MKLHFGNFGKRFCAYMLDILFLYIIFMVLSVLNNMLHLLRPFMFAGICYGITVLYFAAMESGAHQATLGKRILGLVVVHSGTGEPISFARAFLRNLVRLVNIPIYCLGYLTALVTPKSQTLHDLIVQTMVIPIEEAEDVEDEEDDSEEE